MLRGISRVKLILNRLETVFEQERAPQSFGLVLSFRVLQCFMKEKNISSNQVMGRVITLPAYLSNLRLKIFHNWYCSLAKKFLFTSFAVRKIYFWKFSLLCWAKSFKKICFARNVLWKKCSLQKTCRARNLYCKKTCEINLFLL